MTEGAISPKLVSLAWPLVAGNLLQTFYNLADMFWVGRVSAEAVAAVSLMFPTAWMFISTAMGVTAAAVALVSQHVGAGNDREAEHVVGQTILLALAASFILASVGWVIREPLVALIGAEGQVYTESLAYIEVIFMALPFTFLFFAFRAVLRGAGDTKTAMWLVVVSAGINVVIDPFFILGWWIVPEMGTRGAAVATLISRAIAAIAGLYVLLNGGWGIRLRLRDLRPDPERLKRLIDVGYPASADGLTRSFAAVAFAGLVARFGPVPTAAYGITLRYMSVSWTVSGAVGQATATGVGQNLGARTPERADEVNWKGTVGAMAVLTGAAALILAFPRTAMAIFIDNEAVVAEGVGVLWIVAPFWAFFGGLMVIQGSFRGAGQTRIAFVLSLASRWIFRIPVAWLLAYHLAWGPDGLWWALAISAVASFVLGAVWWQFGGWEEGVIGGDGESPGSEPAPTGAAADPDPESETVDD